MLKSLNPPAHFCRVIPLAGAHTHGQWHPLQVSLDRSRPGLKLRSPQNHFHADEDMPAFYMFSGVLDNVAGKGCQGTDIGIAIKQHKDAYALP